MSKLKTAARVLNIIPQGLSRSVRKIQRGEYLTVLCYHRILDADGDFPYDSDLISASTGQFRDQLRYISKRYNVLNFRQLAEQMEETGRFPSNGLIITFDDGYYDNYKVAWPILKEFGMTATFFTAAGYIGKNRLFWWDRLAWIIKKAAGGRIELPGDDGVSFDLADYPDRQKAAGILIRKAKFLPEERKEALIARLSSELDVQIDEDQHSNTMTWDQLRELDNGGIEIGAHSIGHPIFSNIDDGRLEEEVAGSKRLIESELGTKIVTFGSPGRGVLTSDEKVRFEELLKRLIRDSGYSFSTMYKWGLVHSDEFDPFAIERLGIETHDNMSTFRAKLAFPEIIKY